MYIYIYMYIYHPILYIITFIFEGLRVLPQKLQLLPVSRDQFLIQFNELTKVLIWMFFFIRMTGTIQSIPS